MEDHGFVVDCGDAWAAVVVVALMVDDGHAVVVCFESDVVGAVI